jgi:hypothetical protein
MTSGPTQLLLTRYVARAYHLPIVPHSKYCFNFVFQIEWQGGGQLKWVMACEAEVIRDLIPRLRGIDEPKLCGDAYRHCFKRGRESTETIQDSIAAEQREAALRVSEYFI